NRFLFRWGGIGFFLALLQFSADNAYFEEQAASLDTFLEGFELGVGDFAGTVGNVDQHAFEFIEDAGQRSVTLLLRGLPIQAVFFEKIAGAALLGGDIDELVLASPRLSIGQLDEHHFGFAKVLADGDNQDAFTNLFSAGHRGGGFGVFGHA